MILFYCNSYDEIEKQICIASLNARGCLFYGNLTSVSNKIFQPLSPYLPFHRAHQILIEGQS